jgi:dCTP deaminase
MIKSDKWIIRMARERKMIEPFAESQVRNGVISYGVSSYGYDFRVGNEFKIFSGSSTGVVDPKDFAPKLLEDVKTDTFAVIPPNCIAIARSVEYFRIPRNVITIAFGKSTYARCGILVNITPFEPEWEGFVTLSIINSTSVPAKVYANEGIAQVLFLESDEACQVSYADKKGKYQAQQNITLPKI